jgi:Ca2+-binding RTX toxin-like protein
MAPVKYTLAQISAILQTQWGGDDNGTTRWWREADHTIEYSLPATSPTRAKGEDTGFRTMTATEYSYARLAFELWDELIAWDLNEVDNTDAQITMAMSSSTKTSPRTSNGGTYATQFLVAQPPGSSTFERDIERQRIWLSTTWPEFQYGTFDYGERGLEVMLHEIGHTLGLSHPGPYDASDVTAPTYADDALYTQDTLLWTIMSYWPVDADGTEVERDSATTTDTNDDGINAATPLLHDVMAIQAKYGADMTTRAGNDTYGFNASFSGPWRPVFDFAWAFNVDPVIAIWDAGGIDTLNVSGYGQNQRLDLAPGAISDVGALTQNVAIAYGAVIENAIGGTGADSIRGNHVGNYLFGGEGIDTIEGFDGNDTLDPWHDGGWMDGGNGQDVLWSGNGSDYMDGGDGTDQAVFSRSPAAIIIDQTAGKVTGGDAQGDTLVDIEQIVASSHNDFIHMDVGDNTIWAGDGNDQVDGGRGSDSLYGEAGNDLLRGGPGRWVGDLFYAGDWIDGGEGWDIAAFQTAVTVDLRSGGVHGGEAREDTFISIEQFNGSPERDVFYGGNLNDKFQGGAEGDYINGGGGSDTASYADRTSGITAQMSFNNLAAGDELRSPNEIAGRTDGKVSPADSTWVDTLISIENIEGTNFDDILLGDERANTLWGLDGNDRIEGDDSSTPQGSRDDMYGGAGDDRFIVGINDLADGGIGNDVASFVGGALLLDFVNFNFSIGGTAIHVRDIETYIGTDFNDTVIGANYGETINLGAGGSDWADGQGGDDFLYTSEGYDVLIGGTGFDTVVFHRSMMASWQTGDLDAAIAETWESWEAIQGAGGVDVIRTNDWGYSVELRGGPGNDILASGPGQSIGDTLMGEEGDDWLDGGAGADSLIGGDGNDTYIVDHAADVVTESNADALTGGSDTISSSVSLTLGANLETLILTGSAAIHGTGNSLDNRITGNGAANTLNGRAGADSLIGGDGNDIFIVDNTADVVIETNPDPLSGGIDTVSSSISRSLGANQENLILTGSAAIHGTGNTLNNRITGNTAANTLTGGPGADTLSGGAGADTLIGGDGNDTYIVESAADVVTESNPDPLTGGIDTVSSSISRSLGANQENLTLTGSATINGIGNSLNNRIIGNGSPNTLIGGLGADTLIGGDGNDTYIVESAADVIAESNPDAPTGGMDTIRSSVSRTLGANQEILILTGSAAIHGTGNSLDNRISGNAAANILTGGAGADTLIGGDGDDTYSVENAADVVAESNPDAPTGGMDTIRSSVSRTLGANQEILILTGSAAIHGTGNSLDNRISGNASANTLTGGAGADTLTGGLGADTFRFDSALNSRTNRDVITDFSLAQGDKIELENLVFTALNTPGVLAPWNFFVGASATEADQRILYNSVTGFLSYDRDGSGPKSSLIFAALSPGLVLSPPSFIVT